MPDTSAATSAASAAPLLSRAQLWKAQTKRSRVWLARAGLRVGPSTSAVALSTCTLTTCGCAWRARGCGGRGWAGSEQQGGLTLDGMLSRRPGAAAMDASQSPRGRSITPSLHVPAASFAPAPSPVPHLVVQRVSELVNREAGGSVVAVRAARYGPNAHAAQAPGAWLHRLNGCIKAARLAAAGLGGYERQAELAAAGRKQPCLRTGGRIVEGGWVEGRIGQRRRLPPCYECLEASGTAHLASASHCHGHRVCWPVRCQR